MDCIFDLQKKLGSFLARYYRKKKNMAKSIVATSNRKPLDRDSCFFGYWIIMIHETSPPQVPTFFRLY